MANKRPPAALVGMLNINRLHARNAAAAKQKTETERPPEKKAAPNSDKYARAHQALQDRPHRSVPQPHLGDLNVWGDPGAMAWAEDSGASDAEQESVMTDLMEGSEG